MTSNEIELDVLTDLVQPPLRREYGEISASWAKSTGKT
jgi:hypothetical protein